MKCFCVFLSVSSWKQIVFGRNERMLFQQNYVNSLCTKKTTTTTKNNKKHTHPMDGMACIFGIQWKKHNFRRVFVVHANYSIFINCHIEKQIFFFSELTLQWCLHSNRFLVQFWVFIAICMLFPLSYRKPIITCEPIEIVSCCGVAKCAANLLENVIE